VFDRVYPHRAQDVWDAISTPEGLAGWLLCTDVTIEPRVGGRIEMVSGVAGYRSKGAILVWDPPRCFAYEWTVAPVPEMPAGEHAIFRYELTPDGDETHLRVTYSRITASTARGFLPGLHAYLDRLEAQLDGRPLPDWMARFVEARSAYPRWTGHATSSAE
jgi:uncharacterized protein YndB with AHSA1/START domain